MERHEALRLIKESLETIVPYLQNLQRKLKPVFEEKGYTPFGVGVSVVETCAKKDIIYKVQVHNRNDKKMMASEIDAIVREVDSEYKGISGVSELSTEYPITSFLNLCFLEDLQKAF